MLPASVLCYMNKLTRLSTANNTLIIVILLPDSGRLNIFFSLWVVLFRFSVMWLAAIWDLQCALSWEWDYVPESILLPQQVPASASVCTSPFQAFERGHLSAASAGPTPAPLQSALPPRDVLWPAAWPRNHRAPLLLRSSPSSPPLRSLLGEFML